MNNEIEQDGFVTVYSTDREEAWMKGWEIGYDAGYDKGKSDYFVIGLFIGGFFIAAFILSMIAILSN